jgi:proteasome accessory factor B
MSVQKSERLLNLLIMLLVQRRPVGKDRIREILYPTSSTEAFEKMFERDKEELRSLGVPVEVAHLDAFFDDETGYLIRPDEFALPDITLEPDEASVIGLAAKVWEHARLAEATTEAVRKLTAAGLPVDVSALDLVQPRLAADEPAFDAFWQATHERAPLTFDYARPGQPAITRHLQPWGVVRYSGRWYAVGLDTDRNEERVFRLSRVRGEPRRDGPGGSFEVPAGTDVRDVARRLAPSRPRVEPAVVLVRSGCGHQLRRRAAAIETDVRGPDTSTSWDQLTFTNGDVADEVLTHGADAFVVAPVTLRDSVVERLSAVVEGVTP